MGTEQRLLPRCRSGGRWFQRKRAVSLRDRPFRYALRIVLELELQPQHHRSARNYGRLEITVRAIWFGNHRGERPERSGSEATRRVSEVLVVKYIVEVGGEPEHHATLRDVEILEEGEIRTEIVRAAEEIAPRISEIGLLFVWPKSRA